MSGCGLLLFSVQWCRLCPLRIWLISTETTREVAESSAKKALAAEIIAQKCTTQLATNAVSGAKCLFGRQAKGLFIVAIALKKNAVIPCPRETKGEILVTETVADFILKRGGCIRQYVIIAARSAKCRLCQAKAGKRIVKNVLIVARQQVNTNIWICARTRAMAPNTRTHTKSILKRLMLSLM